MRPGVVIKSTGSLYKVLDEEGNFHECRLRGRFRVAGMRTTNPVAVGDHVTIDTGAALIVKLWPRRNYIIRRSSNLSKESQIIAANIDQALLVMTVRMPATPIEFVDRYLATAEAYRIPAIVVVNKIDICREKELARVSQINDVYQKAGYRVIMISAKQQTNLDILREALVDKITLVSGNSGVGKSTLINLLNPSLSLKTGVISDYHEQGRHITTFPEMHPLPGGGYVIDTPGIRGFGVIDFDPGEVYHFFPEIFRESVGCRFHNCLHLDEPGCAVIKAVKEGEIALWRYKSYLSLTLENNEKYR